MSHAFLIPSSSLARFRPLLNTRLPPPVHWYLFSGSHRTTVWCSLDIPSQFSFSAPRYLELPPPHKFPALTPIERVPTDVLICIFETATLETVESVGQGALPVLLRVSKKWSAIAREHSVLWATFSFTLFPGAGHSARNIELVHLHLRRSKGAPLTIEVDSTNPYERSAAGAASLIFLLAAHSERLYSLRLTGKYPLFGLRGRLPNLEILQIPSFDSYDRQMSRELEIAPRLHTLILDDPGFDGPIPFPRLRSLCLLKDINPAALPRFSHITSLTTTLCRNDYRSVLGAHAVLHRLVSWKIEFNGHFYTPPHFFDHFTTPALEKLEIATFVQPGNLGRFIQRSGCSLKTLKLRRCSVRISELLQIFEASPCLDSFSIEEGSTPTPTAVTDRLLEALTVKSDRTALLPSLMHLLIDGDFFFRDEILLAMLESRTPAAVASKPGYAPMELVELCLFRVVKGAHVRRLRALQDEQDLDVTLDCANDAGFIVHSEKGFHFTKGSKSALNFLY
ncbi:hypothetical protein DFH06DRAFT_1365689 [Mycena polygramma]|nr:hypothetical protein DFH06DRAFT_1365689 [Mycena polygramma]